MIAQPKTRRVYIPNIYSTLSYLALWVAIALEGDELADVWTDHCTMTYRPLGSVCFDHVGVQRSTVPAHEAGKCSSNIVRYQYLDFVSDHSHG